MPSVQQDLVAFDADGAPWRGPATRDVRVDPPLSPPVIAEIRSSRTYNFVLDRRANVLDRPLRNVPALAISPPRCVVPDISGLTDPARSIRES